MGTEPRRGRGPKKGAPNAGRPPDWLKATQRLQREQALELIGKRLDEDSLDANQLLRIVKEYAPPDELQSGVEVTVEPDGSVRMKVGSRE